MKKYLGILLIIMALACTLTLVACNGDGETPTSAPTDAPTDAPTEQPTEQPTEPPVDEKITYSVEFVDYKGNTLTSFSGVVTYADGSVAAVLSQGKASFEAAPGEYEVCFDVTNSDGYEYEEEYTLTAESNQAKITVYSRVTDTNKDFYASEYGAGYVHEGATYVKLRGVTSSEYEGERSFFIFKPQRDGIYKISVISENNVAVGYHGGTVHTVFPHSLNDVIDNTVEVQFHKGSIGADSSVVCIIGLTTDGSAKDAVLIVERIADMPTTFADIPWDIPAISGELSEHRLSYQNKIITLNNLDLMDEDLTLVLGADGFYHLGDANGPIVYVRISANVDYFGFFTDEESGQQKPNMASFATIIETGRMCRYFSDGDGNPLRKESYNEIIEAYAAVTDASGVYPLDQMLEYVIKQHGEHAGWWNYDSENNLYDIYEVAKPPVENAWLFAACTVEISDTGVDAENPLLINPEGSSSLVSAGDTVYFKINEKETVIVILTVNAGEGITVTYGSETYAPNENGQIVLNVTEDKTFIINASESLDGELKVTYSYEYAKGK